MDEIQVAVFRWPGPEAHPTPGKKDRVCRTVVRRLACLLSFILSAVPALTAQSFDERFSDCFSKGDTAAARRVLRQWEASAERPAEFFVAGLNDCFRMARQSLIVLGNGPGNGPTLETVDPAGSCRELSLSEAVRYGTALVRRGIAYVDRGIEAYLSRLDMRFGKIRALGEIGDYDRYDEAKPLLMRAERLAPRDMTILADLAELHVRKVPTGITLCGGSASWRRKSDISRIRIRSLRGRFCAECLSESWKIGGNRSMGEQIL